MTIDTTERGLESLICAALTGSPCEPAQAGAVRERPATYGVGWLCGDPTDYDRELCVDLAQLSAFLRATQPEAAGLLSLDEDSPTRLSGSGTVHINEGNVSQHTLDRLAVFTENAFGARRNWSSIARYGERGRGR